MPRWRRVFFRLTDTKQYEVFVEAETRQIADHLSWVFMLRNVDVDASSLYYAVSALVEV